MTIEQKFYKDFTRYEKERLRQSPYCQFCLQSIRKSNLITLVKEQRGRAINYDFYHNFCYYKYVIGSKIDQLGWNDIKEEFLKHMEEAENGKETKEEGKARQEKTEKGIESQKPSSCQVD